MSSPTQGAWICAHGVDGRDFCGECYSPAPVLPHSRGDRPHGHDGEFSATCDRCRDEWVDDRVSAYLADGEPAATAQALAGNDWWAMIDGGDW